MQIQQLLMDYNIDYVTEGNKHCTPGWVQIHCPFCEGTQNYHLGINENKNYGNCWRCGSHRLDDILSNILHMNKSQVWSLIQQYGGYTPNVTTLSNNKTEIEKKEFKFPSMCNKMEKFHHLYLQRRNFDSYKLEYEWNLMGTGPISLLDHKDYKLRIIIPIMWDNKIVSFQGRDITGKVKTKYKACPKNRELILHQSILYGNQNQWDDIGICVEGVADVWRLGTKSFAVFGIKYTPAQVRCIAKNFKRVIILFDNEIQAQQQADKLMGELRFRGVETIKETVESDPGDLKQDDADYLVKQLTKHIY